MDRMRLLLLPTLVLVACLSPALTYATLWQTKEWRVDRLHEHLKAEGWLRQLFGVVRPSIVACSAFFALIPVLRVPWFVAGTAVLAAASVAQLAAKKQRMPAWTTKAMILVLATLSIDVTLGIPLLASGMWAVILVPLLQPFILALVWTLFHPVDRIMKQRVLRKATTLRAVYVHATAIGITGSAGKTTTKELLTHILKGPSTIATPAYVNSEMGVAQWLLRELPKHTHDKHLTVIAEMGAYRTGEIAQLCRIVQPQMGVVTLIGSQHVALFGSARKLLAAKSELLAALPENGTAFINADCSGCLQASEAARCPVVRVSTGGKADLEARDIEETSDGIRFFVGETAFVVPLHGTHNVINVLLAVAVAERCGTSIGESAKKLRTFRPPHSTFAVRNERGVMILDDTHNSSASSFRAAIAWAKSQPASRKILLTPGIIELGEETDRIHQDLGAAASDVIDRVIFTTMRGKDAFEQGYGKTVELLGKTRPTPVESDSLLLCVGRVSAPIINAFLPRS